MASLDEQWSRTGAANVAGVTYQIAVTAHMLVSARAGDLGIESVVPEGDEDIDCSLVGGTRILVQAKDRGTGRLTAATAIGVVLHAAEAVGDDSRLALVTDTPIGDQLAETGWHETLVDHLDSARFDELVSRLAAAGEANGLTAGRALSLLSRTHVVHLPWRLAHASVSRLAEVFDLAPAVAALVHARLLEDLAQVASEQRARSRQDAVVRQPADVDSFVTRVVETVDPNLLDAAEQAGIVRIADFTRSAEVSIDRFLSGVDAKPGHIAAGLDLPRPRELAEVFEALRRDRYALIVGPSGAGKSALLWRVAREAGPVRPTRVLHVCHGDEELLRRWVELQAPSPETPVLLCGDDLGRPHMSAWIRSIESLLEIPGVLVVGAARSEDFRPELALGRATVVQPTLDRGLADSIAVTLREREVETRVDAGEAFLAADGLLMEFLSLLVVGRRFEDVVTSQVRARMTPDRQTERELMRYVCAAHIHGVPVPARALSCLLHRPADLHEALGRLREEHLVTTDDSESWVGLHELRSAVVHRCLHELPPPTASETVAALLPHIDREHRRHLLVRHAMASTADLAAVAERVAEMVCAEDTTATVVAELSEALEEVDAVRYARDCLAVVAEESSSARVFGTLRVAFGMRLVGADSIPIPKLRDLANRLPERPSSLRVRALRGLGSGRVAELFAESSTPTGVRLLESLEGCITLDADHAKRICRGLNEYRVDDRSRLIASVFELVGLERSQAEEWFGSIGDRLRALVDEHVNGVDWSVGVDEEGKTVATVRLMTPCQRSDEGEEPDAHEQAVQCAERIVSLCPEADVAEVRTVDGDGGVHAIDGHEPAYKRIPRSNLPRAVTFRPNARMLDAARRLLACRFWTERLRDQAAVAVLLVDLLGVTAERVLHIQDNSRRRRKWCSAVDRARAEIARLPEPPIEHLDRETPDHAMRALQRIADVLAHVGQWIDGRDFAALPAIAAELRGATSELREARAQPHPTLASVGDPLPGVLDQLVAQTADLLFALANSETDLRKLRSGSSRRRAWGELAAGLVESARRERLRNEETRIREALGDAQDQVMFCRLPHFDERSVTLVCDRWLVVVPLEKWHAVAGLLDIADDELRILAFRTYALAEFEGKILPLVGARLGVSRIFPLEGDEIDDLVRAANLPPLDVPGTQDAQEFVAVLERASRAFSLIRLRGPGFRRATLEQLASGALSEARAIVDALGGPARLVAQDLLEAVEAEADADAGGATLAGELALAARGNSPAGVAARIGELFALVVEDGLHQ